MSHAQVERHNPEMKNTLVHVMTDSLNHALRHDREIVFVGIGTPKVSGDSFGPALASKLKDSIGLNWKVYGHLEDPIHNENFMEKLSSIQLRHPHAFLIGLDAFCSMPDEIGKVRCSLKEELKGYTSGDHPSSVHDAMILGHTINKTLGSRGLYALSRRCINAMVDFAHATILEVFSQMQLLRS